MNEEDITRHTLSVRSLIELAIETASLSASRKAQQLAEEVKIHAAAIRSIKTPDGWFVPIRYLLPKVEEVAEFFRAEILQYGGFEVAGGFEILTSDGASLGVPLSSDFRSAMTLAETIIHQQEESQVLVGGQEIWKMFFEDDKVRIQIGQMSARHGLKEFQLPAEALRKQLEIAQMEVAHFATALELLLLRYQDISITAQQIKWIFGLDKLRRRSLSP